MTRPHEHERGPRTLGGCLSEAIVWGIVAYLVAGVLGGSVYIVVKAIIWIAVNGGRVFQWM